MVTDEQILAAASVDDRALFAPMQAPIELTPINVDELLQTQRFYAVGSIIAMPKAQMAEPVLEPESFDTTITTAATIGGDRAQHRRHPRAGIVRNPRRPPRRRRGAHRDRA